MEFDRLALSKGCKQVRFLNQRGERIRKARLKFNPTLQKTACHQASALALSVSGRFAHHAGSIFVCVVS